MIKKMSPSESEYDIPAKNCYRMVILGSTKVGKTAIVSRFLNSRFEEQYTPTIEDFHRKLYSIKGDVYQLDILDTSGNHPFPAMRRLSILTDLRDQVVPKEQDQGARGRAAGHLRQQERPRDAPRGAAGGYRAAAGRGREMRVLRDLGQAQRERGQDVPDAIHHGQAAARDESRPAPQGVRAVLRGHAAQEVREEQEAEGQWGCVRHCGPVCAPPERAQRPAVHQGEGGGRGWGQGEGEVLHQLKTSRESR
ncbi:dexamethasone-induced Ras-related protein 1 isoform X2 [Gadus morhua]|uniref:dexamethasone-induced Ras-related protein 1 isoform X2 n=1 Tax=Gadus morhua TaxID=8049 RepID=UPI0011B568A6|nr:dexamethasone-induced Ras-related protein 1 isoform X2 [Gadus morhua]XP_056433105.1 dexamethasone-induced Ras-related protein 1 isoform X2 [Gadus chalcogrammus]